MYEKEAAALSTVSTPMNMTPPAYTGGKEENKKRGNEKIKQGRRKVAKELLASTDINSLHEAARLINPPSPFFYFSRTPARTQIS